MPRIILLILLFLSPIGLMAQSENFLPIPSEIKEVTVFLQGAQVKRMGTKLVKSGTHRLIFEGLSANIDPNSIQVKGEGKITILSVNHRMNYLSGQEKPKRVVSLEDSLEDLRFDQTYNSKLLEVYNQERSMILANQRIGWEKSGFAVEDVEDLADFYRDRLSDIMLKMLEIETKQQRIRQQQSRMQAQLRELSSKWRKSTGEIEVEVAANQTTSAKLMVSYLVRNAGWEPAYDLRSGDIREPMELRYNARVIQNTGVDWKDVKLTLSTSNPSLGGTKPELSPWRLRVQQPYGYQQMDAKSNRAYQMDDDVEMEPAAEETSNATPMPKMDGGYDNNAAPAKAKTTANYTSLAEGQTNISFEIKLPYTIPADNSKHLVSVSSAGLPAEYLYSCSPKLDLNAFLVAQVTGWEAYKLLSGYANIYFEDTFIGSSYINTNTTDKKLDISLGRDKSIVVTRKRIEDYSAKKESGNNVKEIIGVEISVRNTKSVPVSLLLEDQVPVSTSKDVEVDIEEITGAKLDEATGRLEWRMDLQPSETRKVVLKYSVKYPKGIRINL